MLQFKHRCYQPVDPQFVPEGFIASENSSFCDSEEYAKADWENLDKMALEDDDRTIRADMRVLNFFDGDCQVDKERCADNNSSDSSLVSDRAVPPAVTASAAAAGASTLIDNFQRYLTIFVNFRQFSTISDNFRQFLTILRHFSTFFHIFRHFSTSFDIFGHFWTFCHISTFFNIF